MRTLVAFFVFFMDTQREKKRKRERDTERQTAETWGLWTVDWGRQITDFNNVAQVA